MSRDFTSQEWADELRREPEQELDRVTRYGRYIRRAAFLEGMTAHLRNDLWPCPFCQEATTDLPGHLVACGEVPEHLREGSPGEKVPE